MTINSIFGCFSCCCPEEGDETPAIPVIRGGNTEENLETNAPPQEPETPEAQPLLDQPEPEQEQQPQEPGPVQQAMGAYGGGESSTTTEVKMELKLNLGGKEKSKGDKAKPDKSDKSEDKKDKDKKEKDKKDKDKGTGGKTEFQLKFEQKTKDREPTRFGTVSPFGQAGAVDLNDPFADAKDKATHYREKLNELMAEQKQALKDITKFDKKAGPLQQAELKRMIGVAMARNEEEASCVALLLSSARDALSEDPLGDDGNWQEMINQALADQSQIAEEANALETMLAEVNEAIHGTDGQEETQATPPGSPALSRRSSQASLKSSEPDPDVDADADAAAASDTEAAGEAEESETEAAAEEEAVEEEAAAEEANDGDDGDDAADDDE